MKTIILTCLLALAPALVGAAPIAFLSAQYSTSAIGIAGTAFDEKSAQSPPLALPLTSFAIADDGAALGTAAAIADIGVVIAQADALGSEDGAAGSASAEYLATFLAAGGPVALTFDFATDVLIEDAGFAAGSLRVVLLANAITVFDQSYSATGAVQVLLDMPAGSLGTVSLLLLATADAPSPLALASAGSAVTFALQSVPEPGSAMLMVMTGMSMLLVARGRAGRNTSARGWNTGVFATYDADVPRRHMPNPQAVTGAS